MAYLTRQQFQAEIKRLGYTQDEVAKLWEMTPARLSQIARDPQRSPLYEYALWGLPSKRTAARVTERRTQAARALGAVKPPERAEDSQDVWTDLTAVRAVFVVREEQGEHLPEGCEGIVVARAGQGGACQVSIQFDSGYHESYSLSYLKDPACFLSATGVMRAAEPG